MPSDCRSDRSAKWSYLSRANRVSERIAVEQLALGDDAERADRRQGAAVVAVQLVDVVAVEDVLALALQRQIDVVQEHVPWVAGSVTALVRAFTAALAAIARVVTRIEHRASFWSVWIERGVREGTQAGTARGGSAVAVARGS
jgi:hypothetical protein